MAPAAVVRGEGREAGAGTGWSGGRVALTGVMPTRFAVSRLTASSAVRLSRQPADGKPVRRYLVARMDTWPTGGRQPSFAVSFIAFCRQPADGFTMADGISSLRRQPMLCRQLGPGLTAYVPLPSAPIES